MNGNPAAEPGLRKEISHLGYGAISLNSVVGAGIFALPAVAASAAGLFSPWLFVFCGLLIMTVVLSLARAASFFSQTGGPLAYTGHAFGAFAGFQVGWLFTLARVAALSANTNLLVTYLGWFWSPLTGGVARQVVIAGIILLLTVVNVVGVRQGMLVVFVLSALKLLPLGLLVLTGIGHANPDIFLAAGLPPFGGFGETLLVLLYAFVGFESTVVPAGEGRNPRRDIPRALVQSVFAVSVLYVLIQVVVISVDPGIGSSSRPLIDVAEILMGPAGAMMMAAGAVFSITGNLSSMMVSAPRMLYAMGHSRVLPPWFGRVHSRFGTPVNAVLFMSVLGLALALSGSFIWLAAMSTVVRLLVYAVSIAALPRLNRSTDDTDGRFELPGGYAIPLLALLLIGWLVTQAPAQSWIVAGIFMALGSVFYVANRWSGARSLPG